jgi:hypothetical protein
LTQLPEFAGRSQEVAKMMTPETSNPIMDLSSVIQPTVSNSRAAAEAVLDLRLQAMRKLKMDQELSARGIGLLVKEIIDDRTWEEAGYLSAEDCFQRKFKEIAGRTTLYRYKAIAERFSDDEVRQFGTTMLEAALVHETNTGERLPDGNRGEHEIRLAQKDGSEVVKKLKDCSANELIRSNHNRRKSGHAEAIKAATAQPGMLSKVVLAGVGVVMLVVADLLPSSWLSSVMTLLGASMLLAGGSHLVRRGYNWLASFIRSGQAVELLVTMPSKLPSIAANLGRKVVAGLKRLASLSRAKQAIHALAKLPSKLPSLKRKSDHAPSAKSQTQPPLTGGLAPPAAS